MPLYEFPEGCDPKRSISGRGDADATYQTSDLAGLGDEHQYAVVECLDE
jgi:hypothetical protein